MSGHVLAGRVDAWFAGCDPVVRAVSGEVNGPLMQHLAELSAYHDPDVVSMFKKGAVMTGLLPTTGNGDKIMHPVQLCSRHELLSASTTSNRKLAKKLHSDPCACELLRQIETDASTSQRMTAPVLLKDMEFEQFVMSRRFSRVQGVKADGSPKIRAVDDCTGSGLNATASPTEKLHHHHLDQLLRVAEKLREVAKTEPLLWKADIDSAYRRIPVAPEDRELLYVGVLRKGDTFVARHNAAPFGAVASVHAWERCGALIWFVACKVLHLPVLRYVDDYFSAEEEASCRLSMEVFARLVRALLGGTAISESKLQCGNPLTVLGA